MTSKTTLPEETMAPVTPPAAGTGPAELAARWAEARHAYPIYAALATQYALGRLPHPEGEMPPPRPTRQVFDRDLRWLDELDDKIKAFQLRQLLPDALNTSEESLRAFINRQLKKPAKGAADRDKIDFLLVQYFALCAPDRLYHDEIHLEDVATILKPVLSAADPTPLDWCHPLEQILESVQKCRSLRDLLESGLLEQGRLLKETAGALFYDPAALVAFCRFNFLLRRNFILLLHADQKAVVDAVSRLESQGVKVVDCRRAGFSAAEPLTRVRQFSESWRQPYKKDYTENSVSRAFEQLLALRADLEEALAPKPLAGQAKTSGPAAESEVAAEQPAPSNGDLAASPSEEQALGVPLAHQPPSAEATPEAGSDPAKPASPSAEGKVPPKPKTNAVMAPTTQVEMENCLESIWEQLIDAPPSRGRSMSTVVLKNTKVLLSSWEVAAFVTEGGQDSDDLRRAVVARALLAMAIDARKHSGDSTGIESALALARSEVSYFQGRVEQSKRAKNTEAAVNLSISTKRLLSIIEEAEALQP
ncbi:MAG: hypothetical protein WBC04_16410 [Candidatus Acidiferrales bacterium]